MPVRVKGIGVDLVSLARARRFLERHPAKAFRRLLTASEKKRFPANRLTPAAFARLFAAKEAFFKAVGESWMGLEGFGAIEIKSFPRGRFRVQSSRFLDRPGHAEGRFFGTREFVGAQVILWEN